MNSTLEYWRNVKTKDEILENDLKKSNKKLEDRFKHKTEFGTAGIRGVMGAGFNYINIHTIRQAAMAYGKYLIKYVKNAENKGVVIGHDNRHNGKLYAEECARIMQDLGIKSYLYNENEMQPTPFISYTIRKLKMAGGINITASHNPKEYNGFKAYNPKGGQLMPTETKKIQKIMEKINPLSIGVDYDKKLGYIRKDFVEEYINEVLGIRLRPNDRKKISVAFSPLHGTSRLIGPAILEKMDIKHYEVEAQMFESTEFKNVSHPNPEDGRSLDAAVSLAKYKRADLAIITDPDADRIGVAVKHKRRFKYLNGNQMAALYLDYKLQNIEIPKRAFIVTSNVSGNLAKRIAEKYGIKIYTTHVGFKNIVDMIDSKKKGGQKFIFAYEESYGFLMDENIARDKDAIQGLVGIVEMANYYKTQGINLYEKLKDLYSQYGIHRNMAISRKMTQGQTTFLMNKLSKLKEIGGKVVVNVEDYRKKIIDELPKTNLIKIIFKDGSWLAIRPSGTEPKVKIYIQTVGTTTQTYIDIIRFEKEVETKINEFSEVVEIKSTKKKIAIKFSFLLIIFGFLMWFVFKVVFEMSDTGDVFKNAFTLKGEEQFLGFLVLVYASSSFVGHLVSAYIRARLLAFSGNKVKFRYLIVSTYLGRMFSAITPLGIGGEGIEYYYLRKKGVKRAPLVASLFLTTILWQIQFVINTALLLVVGWRSYSEFLFANDDPQATAATWMFIIGIVWSIFAAIMLITIGISSKFQNFIIKYSVIVLEWLPFIHITDPGSRTSGYMYQMYQMRTGMKRMLAKKSLLAEIATVKTVWAFLSPITIVFISMGLVKGGLPDNSYISAFVASDITSTANSFAVTPGGSGTGEWLNITIKQELWDGSKIGLSGKEVEAGLNVFGKIYSSWPILSLSALLNTGIIIANGKKVKFEKWWIRGSYFAFIMTLTLTAVLL